MLITDIVAKDKKKSVIYLDYEKAFSLYGTEVRRFRLCVGDEMPEQTYKQIMTEILPKRCLERAVYLLKSSDKTCSDLRQKLLRNDYPEEMIAQVIGRLLEYHYLDDERYTRNYIQYHSKAKSIKRIQNELLTKGISKDLIRMVLEEYQEEEKLSERQYELVKKEFRKKKYDFERNDRNEKNKIIASLYRKGFSFELIEKVFRDMEKDWLKCI